MNCVNRLPISVRIGFWVGGGKARRLSDRAHRRVIYINTNICIVIFFNLLLQRQTLGCDTGLCHIRRRPPSHPTQASATSDAGLCHISPTRAPGQAHFRQLQLLTRRLLIRCLPTQKPTLTYIGIGFCH